MWNRTTILVFASSALLAITFASVSASVPHNVESIRILDTDLLDQNRNNVTIAKPHVPVIIQANVVNDQNVPQKLNYIVQVKDNSMMNVESLTWKGYQINANRESPLQIVWTPERAGDYSIEIFFWDSIIDPTPLVSNVIHIPIQAFDTEQLEKMATNLTVYKGGQTTILPVKAEVSPLKIVLEKTRLDIIDEVVDQTGFLTIEPVDLISLKELQPAKEVIKKYKDFVMSKVSIGDQIAKITWSHNSKQITTLAIIDPHGHAKFEPVLYFTPASFVKHGSADTLKITSLFDVEVIYAHINIVELDSPDGCSIKTPRSLIASLSVRHAPLYAMPEKPVPRAEIFKFLDYCPADDSKPLYCARAQADIVFAAFFPEFKVGAGGVEVETGGFPVNSGLETITTERVCPR